jgi:hypothetical protein
MGKNNLLIIIFLLFALPAYSEICETFAPTIQATIDKDGFHNCYPPLDDSFTRPYFSCGWGLSNAGHRQEGPAFARRSYVQEANEYAVSNVFLRFDVDIPEDVVINSALLSFSGADVFDADGLALIGQYYSWPGVLPSVSVMKCKDYASCSYKDWSNSLTGTAFSVPLSGVKAIPVTVLQRDTALRLGISCVDGDCLIPPSGHNQVSFNGAELTVCYEKVCECP